MRSTSAALAASLALSAAAQAQTATGGFALERLAPAPPGSAFFALDDLRLAEGLGGAVALTVGYAHAPLRVDSLAVVRHETLATISGAVSWDRLRLHAAFTSPLYLAGDSGSARSVQFAAPQANVERNPDALFDVTVGADARLYGAADGPLRLGASADLFIPSGDRADYGTDNTYRAAFRALAAGDLGRFVWAGQLGLHLRPLNEPAIPQGPRGSELLVGAAGGARFSSPAGALVVGPEVFGASALRSLFAVEATALEALASARLERPLADGALLRFRLGAGAGLDARFGAPQWRAVLAVELGGQSRRATR